MKEMDFNKLKTNLNELLINFFIDNLNLFLCHYFYIYFPLKKKCWEMIILKINEFKKNEKFP